MNGRAAPVVPRAPSLHHVTGAVHSPVVIVWIGCGWWPSLLRGHLDASGKRQYDQKSAEPSMQLHCTETRLGSLFLTLPTRGLTGQYVISFAGAGKAGSFDHLVSAGEDRRRNRQAERLGGIEVDHQLNLYHLLDRQIAGLAPLRILPV